MDKEEILYLLFWEILSYRESEIDLDSLLVQVWEKAYDTGVADAEEMQWD